MAFGKGIIDDTGVLGINQVTEWHAVSKEATATPAILLSVAQRKLDMYCEVRLFSSAGDFLVSNDPDAPAGEWVSWPKERILVLPLNTDYPRVYVKTSAATIDLQVLAFGFSVPA